MDHPRGEAASSYRAALRRQAYQCALAQLPHALTPHARRQALRLALCPVDFWRMVEFPAVLAAYRGESPVLDLGSPRLLARQLADAHNARVIAGDLSPIISDEMRVYRRGLQEPTLHGLRCDGARLPIADRSVAFAYSVSVLEHIDGEGDRAALRELARVLMPGARLVVTVPCAPRHEEIWLEQDIFGAQSRGGDGKVFFCRLYDWKSARERLAPVEGLELEDSQAWHIKDEPAFQRYRQATARPGSISSVLAKIRDPQHARRLIGPCTPFETVLQTRAVLALFYRATSQP